MFVSVQFFNYDMSEWDVGHHPSMYIYVTDGFMDSEMPRDFL